MVINITEHAFKRLKERNGLSKGAAKRMAEKAYNEGIKHGETTGRLHKFISGKTNAYKRKGTQMRIYGEYLWIFIDSPNKKSTDLVTAFIVPKDLRNNIRGSMLRKKHKNN